MHLFLSSADSRKITPLLNYYHDMITHLFDFPQSKQRNSVIVHGLPKTHTKKPVRLLSAMRKPRILSRLTNTFSGSSSTTALASSAARVQSPSAAASNVRFMRTNTGTGPVPVPPLAPCPCTCTSTSTSTCAKCALARSSRPAWR